MDALTDLPTWGTVAAAVYLTIGLFVLIRIGGYSLALALAKGGIYILGIPLIVVAWPFFWRDILFFIRHGRF